MDKEQRAALRKLAEEATPGPWFCEQENVHTGQVCSVNQGGSPWFEVWSENWSQDSNNQADAAHIAAANPSTILSLLDYIETLEKDARRIDFIEQEAAASRSGVSFDYARLVEDGYVTERGFRMCKFHKLGERHKTLRAAIDAAMQGETE